MLESDVRKDGDNAETSLNESKAEAIASDAVGRLADDSDGEVPDDAGAEDSPAEENAPDKTDGETASEEEDGASPETEETDGGEESSQSEEDADSPEEEDETEASPDEVVNDDDSREKADEVGVGENTDSYGREIIRPVFENRLRLSRNSVKLAYGKIKNTILSRAGMRQRYNGASELFAAEDERLFRLEIGDDELIVYCAGDKNSLDKSLYRYTVMKEKRYASTPLRVIVRKDTEQSESSLRRALDLIEHIFSDRGIGLKEHYVPVAYAERYPFNPQAVLEGKEYFAPVENAFDSEEYAPISGELTRDIIAELMGSDFDVEEKKGAERLEALRQQASTIKGAVALTEPIVYFYDSALNADNTVAYVHVCQVLNDKFMGKLLPQQFFAAAEGSERIERLNLMCVEQMKKDCEENLNHCFCTEISCRMLIRPQARARLLKACEGCDRMIFAFDAALLEAAGKEAFDAIDELKSRGVKIMIDNTENSGMKILTELPIDYLRFDARYYDETVSQKTAHLDMLTGYAKTVGITAASVNVSSLKEAKHLLLHNVTVIQGFAVCEPKRIIYNATKEIKKLPAVAQ